MASPDAIRRAIIALLRKVDEAIPDTDPTAQAIARGQRNPLIGLTPLTKEVPTTSDVIPTTPPTDPALRATADVATELGLVRRGAGPVTKKGPGPEPFTGSTINETMGIAEPRYNQYQRALIEDSAAKRRIDPESQRTSAFDESPDRSGQLEREVMEEVTGPRSRVQGRPRTTMEEMDNLFGAEEAGQVEAIKKQLNEQGIKRSRVPTERDRAEVLNVARDKVKLKEVDQMAKRVFDKIEDLERALTTGKVDVRVAGARGQAVRQQVGGAAKRLKNFKKEAAQAAARARKSGDVSELIALENRLTASPKPKTDELSSLLKQLRLREQANRKTNQPRSTKQLRARIKKLQGS
jgi:hypothetical protein